MKTTRKTLRFTKRCPKCKYNCGKRHKKTFKKRRYLKFKK